MTIEINEIFHIIVPKPRNINVTAVHILFLSKKYDHIKLIAGIRLTVIHETGIINVKITNDINENLRYKINWDIKNMIEHNLIVFVYPK